MTGPEPLTSEYPAPDGPTLATSPALRAIFEALEHRFGTALRAVILYGSCLRSNDLMDGLVDLYVLVDDAPRAEPRLWLRLAGRALPPTVYYLEAPVGTERVRCKYAVLSLTQFECGTGPNWFQPYLWGRFAQPVKLVWCDSPATRARLHAAFFRAGETLLRRAIPALPEQGRLADLWQGALALSYATELRAERQGRAADLTGQGQAFFESMTRRLSPRLGDLIEIADCDGGLVYRGRATSGARRRAAMLWALRRILGKTLSVARLIKGLFTFEGGLDYLAWKLSRHSGQEVVIPDKVRRRPLIHIWGFMRRLHARGVFR